VKDALTEHAERMRGRPLRELFSADPDRGERMHLEAAGWYFDYSKHLVTADVLACLHEFARERGLRARIDAMYAGERVNVTEDRPALHVALRMPRGASLIVEGTDVVSDVHRVLDAMSAFAASVRDGSRRGHTGRPIRNVVNIGIGGSDLGPAMAYHALRPFAAAGLRLRFVSNVDAADLVGALRGLDAAETLFVVSSKTFTTLETLANARSARAWCVAALGGDERAVANHFVAVSSDRERVAAFGIDPAHVFEFWDWVGGRFSLWSAIGLSLMIAIGPDAFGELLAGAHAMDEHFRSAPFEQNVPVTMALLAYWYRVGMDAPTHVVVPYAHALALLPAYLQQLEMESNGKSVRDDGTPVDFPTGAVVWGTPGTNGQHAYFQLLHQGTALAPVDFIGFVHPQAGEELGDHQRLLLANLLGQAAALAFGTDDPGLPPHRVMPGNRPSSVLLAEQLTPYALGALLAAYEHKVVALAALWGIDAFDQWGVELGKQLAGQLAAELASGASGAPGAPGAHDSSTRALIRRVRGASS
jgi:glucose-6-phosphate isomerase